MEPDEDNRWPDPLLLTDASSAQQCRRSHTDNSVPSLQRSVSPVMADLDPSSDTTVDDNAFSGRSMLGFSMTSPDLVICAGSPDLPMSYRDNSSDLFEKGYKQKNSETCTELSLDNGINGPSASKKTGARFSTVCQTFTRPLSPESSFELLPPTVIESVSKEMKGVIASASSIADADNVSQFDSPEDNDDDDCEFEGGKCELVKNYKQQKRELMETRKAMEELKKENQLKVLECQEALTSLNDLQSELMRKSMHVGSLAFAIEGQVKEKGKWFSSLRDLTRKLKIMKIEQIKLSEEAMAYRESLGDMNEISSIIQSKINQQEELHNDLKVKFVEGARKQKELYNQVLELKGNIRVFCRCRPLKAEEISSGASVAIDFESSKDGELTLKSSGASRRNFKFDAVFGPESEQADIFENTAPVAISVLDGYNVCIFAYGQTGTGKTYTMDGTDGARGVNYRTLEELFRIIKEREQFCRYDITVSVMEVYNEQIRDLLASGTQQGVSAKRLEVRQASEGIHHVPGLVEAQVNNVNEVWEVLKTGSNARVIGSTDANEYSSRSHCIHCVMVKGENLLNGECTRSKLWLVDLAGSERIAKTEVQGERLKETRNINRSLSALGDVISALATKSPHIPFRNSKLTHLLQDSLGGDSKVVMFVQISPSENDLNETICSLNFASRVRGVELGPVRKQLDIAEFVKYKQMFEKSKQDSKTKDVQIKKMEETVQSLDQKIKERDYTNKILQEKVKELESQLLVERKLARQHVDTKIAEQHHQQQLMNRDEENMAPMRPPLSTRNLGSLKDQSNLFRPPPDSNFPKFNIDFAEKENNPSPNTLEQQKPPLLFLPKRMGRASLCPPPKQQTLVGLVPRRNSLIPMRSAYTGMLPPQIDRIEESDEAKEASCLLDKIPPDNSGPIPNALEQQQPPLRFLPKRGRASLCPPRKRQTLVGFVPRRTSLIPMPSAYTGMPDESEEASCLIDKIPPGNSPKAVKSGVKKLSNALRQSITQRKIKSPMQQHIRRGGGVNIGMERVRVSIGSRGRIAKRAFSGTGRAVRTKEVQQGQKENERVWHIGNVVRNVI